MIGLQNTQLPAKTGSLRAVCKPTYIDSCKRAAGDTRIPLPRKSLWTPQKKLSITKLEFVQVRGLSLNFYNNTLRKFYKFSDSQET